MKISIKELLSIFVEPESYSIEIDGYTTSLALHREEILRSNRYIEFVVDTADATQLLITIPMTPEYLERCIALQRLHTGNYQMVEARLTNYHAPSNYHIAKVMVQKLPLGDMVSQWLGAEYLAGHLYVGALHEDRAVVEDLTGFGYVDSDNNPVIESKYIWADRFREGRAEVESREGFGLIDTDGGVVIPAIYESLGYNPQSGVSTVRKEGRWAYFSYSGEQLTPFADEYLDEELPLDEILAMGEKSQCEV